ncbi:hypothetical protein BUALT_Bualt16G0000100 [Buddleja alternifolia]|uniref:DUF4283 domain-containing protein n=1 Tax=Buddleja alternifolia TaxID=168488 RepID=A0AAV6WID7_9LAMI|nr:hypothetical protein BUALT_Bualt16G0000100 [Buddleja alternifolia]
MANPPLSSSSPPVSATRVPPDKLLAKPSHRSFRDALQSSLGPSSPRAAKKSLIDIGDRGFGEPHMKTGLRGLFYSRVEMDEMVAHLKFALVGKFSYGVSTINRVRARFARFGLKRGYTVGIIDMKHVLINLSSDEDYTRIWMKKEWLIDGFPMKTFKWNKDFSPAAELLIVPIWISLPDLPIAFYHRKSLHNIACLIGTPLKIDESTADYTRPSFTRVCVEINLLDPLVHEIWLGDDDGDITQKIYYENLPLYCPACKHFGHIEKDCLIFHQGSLDSTSVIPDSNREDLRIGESSAAQSNNKNPDKSKSVFRPLSAIDENEGNQSPPDKIDLNNVDIMENAVCDAVEFIHQVGMEAFEQNGTTVGAGKRIPLDLLKEKHGQNTQAKESINRDKPGTNPPVNTKKRRNKNKPRTRIAPELSPTSMYEFNEENGDADDDIPVTISNRFQALASCSLPQEAAFPLVIVPSESDDSSLPNDVSVVSSSSIDLAFPQTAENSQAVDFEDALVRKNHRRSKSLDDEGIHFKVLWDHEQFLHVKIKHNLLDKPITCTFVYAKCSRSLRRPLWNEIIEMSHTNDPWLVGGDFNTILASNERSGGEDPIVGSMEDFGNTLADSRLLDAGFEGEPFTWTNRRLCQRLDRALISIDWADCFGSTRVIHHPRGISDHRPLEIIAESSSRRTPASFRFQNMWIYQPKN